jgi:hypothetical protein
MIRGLEITSDVADGPQSVIEQQVHHGVAIRMALIHRALAPAISAMPIGSSSPARAAKRPPAKKRGGS